MTQEQLQDALGMIEDDMVAAVDELRQKRDSSSSSSDLTDSSRRNLISFRSQILRRELIKWGGLAAGICVLVGAGYLWTVGRRQSADNAGDSKNHHYSNQANAEAVLEHSQFTDGLLQEAETIPAENNQAGKPETSPESAVTPPSLYLLTQNTSIQATTGTYSWEQINSDGTRIGTEACAMHPLDCEDLLVHLETSEPTLQLQFDSAPGDPYEITVECWSETYWGDTAAKGQSLKPVDDRIALLEGGYIYEVTAKWSQGTVYYAFYAHYRPHTP